MSDPKITSLEKEKTKNPKRVEQGKRLAAISREAKERKKQEREKFFESAENDGNKVFFVIGLIGAAVLINKVFSEPSETPSEAAELPPEPSEPSKAAELPLEPSEAARPPETPPDSFAPRRKRSYEPYTMD